MSPISTKAKSIQNETPDSRNATPSFRTKPWTPGMQLRASEHNSEPQNATPNPQEHSSDFQNITPNFWNVTPEFHQKNSVHNSEPSTQLRLFDGTYSDRQNPIMYFPRTSQSVYNYVILLDSSCSVEVGIPLTHPLQSVDWPGIEQYLSPLQAKRIPYPTQGLWCATASIKAQPQINSMTTPTPTSTHGKITQIRPFQIFHLRASGFGPKRGIATINPRPVLTWKIAFVIMVTLLLWASSPTSRPI